MKVALVHDYLGEFGGAERVLLALTELYPDAPIYTAFYRPGPAWERFKDKDVRVSWAHYIPGFSTKLHSPLRFLAPLIWGSFSRRFTDYDVVITSASWYITKGVTRGVGRTPPRRWNRFAPREKARSPIEICYCHTPPRWLYGYPTSVEWQRYWPVKVYAALVGHFMRMYDWNAAQRVDYFIANSENVKKRIKKFYRRDSTVVYPPVELANSKHEARNPKQIQNSKFKILNSDYYLVVARLVGGKGLEMAVEAAKRLRFPLKVVGLPAGYGTVLKNLQRKSGKNVEFLGYVEDSELFKLYSGAKAFLALAQDEDFGITPVEAMAAGTPVIAYRGGGYTESVVVDKTGMFFDEYTGDSLVKAVKKFEKTKIKPEDCINQAKKFSKERFKREIKSFVESRLK